MGFTHAVTLARASSHSIEANAARVRSHQTNDDGATLTKDDKGN